MTELDTYFVDMSLIWQDLIYFLHVFLRDFAWVSIAEDRPVYAGKKTRKKERKKKTVLQISLYMSINLGYGTMVVPDSVDNVMNEISAL